MVDTSLVGTKAQFAVCLIRGLGGNLTDSSRETLANEVSGTVVFCTFVFLLRTCICEH